MRQIIVGGHAAGITANRYNCLMGGTVWNATENQVWAPIPTAGAIAKLRVKLSGNVAAGATVTITLIVNSVASALTATVTAGNAIAEDITHSVNVVAGDTVSLQVTTTGAPGALNAFWTTEFTATTAGASIFLCNINAWNGGTIYNRCQGVDASSQTINTYRAPMPTAGTFKNMYVVGSAGPGAGGDQFTITLQKNGVNTSLSCVLVDAETTKNDTDDVAVIAANEMNFTIVPDNGPATSPYYGIGLTFISSTDGESVILYGDQTTFGANSYHHPGDASTSWQAAEADARALVQGCTVKKLYISLYSALGVGSATFTVHINGGATALAATVTDPATTGNDTVNSAVAGNGQMISVRATVGGGAPSKIPRWGMVLLTTDAAKPRGGSAAGKLMTAGAI